MRFAYAYAFAASLLIGLSASAADAPRRPNIVLFVADDHGQDAGCYGNAVIKTPNIDALAASGTLYRNAFCTTASCSASRSVILTGLQNHLTGQYGLAHATHHAVSFSSLQTLPVILANNGYRTARIGKFHVAPTEIYKFQTVLPGAGGNRNSIKMADNCKEFLSADKETPFFLYFCTSDPHRSAGVLEENPGKPNAFGSEKPYPGMPEAVYDPKDVVVPPFLPDTLACRAEIAQYYQAVSRVDQGVGRLVQLLKGAGQWQNTVFIYTSDNGIAMPGAKTTTYDAGLRLPLVVRLPEGTAHVRESDAMVSWVGFTPTLLDFAGVKEVLAPPFRAGDPEETPGKQRPAALVPYKFHGRSFRATLEEERTSGWDTIFASHQFHEITMYYPMRVVRTRQYKLIYNIAYPLEYPFAADLFDSATWQDTLKTHATLYGARPVEQLLHRPKFELYDINADPNESHNLADDPAHADVLKDLQKQLKDFQTRTQDPWLLKWDRE